MKLIQREAVPMTLLKIIPHASVLNSQTRKLQAQIYELFNVQTSRHWSWERPLCVIVRPSPRFWWVMQMKALHFPHRDSFLSSNGNTQQPTQRQIEFFVAMPSDYVDAFRTKFKNHEQWRKSTLQVVDDFDECTNTQQGSTDVYRLKYARHDMFSLNADYTQQTSPIRELMAVADELKADESVSVFMQYEPMARQRWKKIATYAWDVWQKGGVPYRAGVDPMRLLRDAFELIAHIFYELKSLFEDAMTAIQNSFFHSKATPRTKEKPKIINHDREELLVNGDLSERTKKKRNQPTFKTSIRLAVTSEDPVRRNMLATSVGAAYGVLAGDNRLEAVKVTIRAKQELNGLLAWKIVDRDPNVMSVDELGKLQQLPTADLQMEYADALESNRRTEVEIPNVFLDDSGILAGTATNRGTVHNVHIPTSNRDFLFTPRVVCGSPRMGKDQHVINFVIEAKRKHGIGAVVPDFIDERNGHRGMADALRDHLPPDDVVDFDLSDTSHAIYLGLQSVFQNVTDTRIAGDLIAEYLSDFLLGDDADDKMQTADYLREACKATMGDILGIKLMFMSQQYRRQKIEELKDTLDMDIWEDFDGMSEGKQGQIYAPAMRRLGQILNSEYLKPMFAQTSAYFDLYKAIEEGKVIVFRCRMPDGIPMSERVKQILAYWIVLITFLIRLAQGGKGAGTFIVLNEPAQFLSGGLVHFLERLLAEGPKYRIAPVIVFHDFSQFKKYPGFVDMLLASSVNWHLFKNTNQKVYERLMPYLSKTFTTPQHAFEATRAFQYIACWLNQGEYETPFVADALPMVGKRYMTMDNSRLTKEHVRTYGRPIRDVLAEIRHRNKMTFQAV